MSPFEIGFLICFGAAWPAAIYKSWVSRTSKGKSPLFLGLILIGYSMGILHKVFYSFDMVIGLYIFNFLMVLTDSILYLRNRRFDRGRE